MINRIQAVANNRDISMICFNRSGKGKLLYRTLAEALTDGRISPYVSTPINSYEPALCVT